MHKIESTKVQQKEIDRIFWSKSGEKRGPVLVLFAGLHGNEPAGMKAVERVAEKLSEGSSKMNGSVYAVSGNISAIKLGVRFLDTDLNRLWERFNTSEDFSIRHEENRPVEYFECLEIKQTINEILKKHSGTATDFVFVDLHTTSVQSCAFILLNDMPANRGFVRGIPVPRILRIEENIRGTLLSYINNLGFKAIAFEAGAHHAETSVDRSEAFLWLVLHRLDLVALPERDVVRNEEILRTYNGVPKTYFKIVHHKIVGDPHSFEMISGFQNFDKIEKGTPLAYEFGRLIKAPESGRIFMPLYQKKGHDGFMIVRRVSDFRFVLSGYLRKSFFHKLLRYLPGVKRAGQKNFEIDLIATRFFVKKVFYLLGYRIIQKDRNTLICYRR